MRHLPNLICLFRILLVWPIATHLAAGDYLLTLALFMLAGASDGLDGFLAKHFNWTSQLGKVLDPLADKLLLVTVYVEAAWLELAPWWLTAAVVARDVFIASGAIIFRIWFGPLHGRPTITSKINTGMQLLFVVAVLFTAARLLPQGGALESLANKGLDVLAVLVLLSTMVSGFDYLTIFTRRALLRSGNAV